MHKAFDCYCQSLPEGDDSLTFRQWCEKREAESPQFHFWSLTLKFQLTIRIFVRSLHEGNLQLYKEACTALVPWFFALNHTNYARWLPVHIRGMESLDKEIPSVAAEFRKGHFVVQKSYRPFLSIPIDQAHEQNNKIVKGDGGEIGLTESSSQLLRWIVAGPEISRIIDEFKLSEELMKKRHGEGPNALHHEQTSSVQVTFQNQVKSLCSVLEEMINPFLEQSEDLLVLGTRDITDSSVVQTVRKIEEIGKAQYQAFVTEKVKKRTTSLFAPIKRNKLSLFSSLPSSKAKSSNKIQIASLKSNCSLCSRLYISSQDRDGNLEAFFCHENQFSTSAVSIWGTQNWHKIRTTPLPRKDQQ